MTLRKCQFCGHLWKDRVTSKQKAPTRCPECHRALRPTIMSRTKITIPTQWLEEHIRKTVEDIGALPWMTETEARRNKLHGRLEALKIIEKTFVLPEEEMLDLKEMEVLVAEPEALATLSPVRGKR